MERKNYTVAIDLGSSNVVVAVGRRTDDGMLEVVNAFTTLIVMQKYSIWFKYTFKEMLIIGIAGGTGSGKTGGKAIGRCFDIKEKSEIDAFFQFVKELGGVDIFVSNAGVTKVCRFLENTEEDLENILRTNFMGAVYCVQAAGRLMRDQKRGGNILLVTSVNAYHPLPTQSFYSSLKAGLEALCKALAYEFYPYGIRFNCVAPGATLTGMSKDMTEEDFSNLNQTVPLGRIGYPEDMAKAVSFMVSEDASYITGASLIVDGGLCLRKDV